MTKVRILLDLDEVLVDFIGGAIGLHGSSLEEVLPHWPPGYWSVVPALGKALSRELTDEDFWRPITDKGREFWLGLLTHPWAEELLSWVKSVTDDWHIVTSPSRCPTSHDGKIRWAKNYFGPNFDRICPYRYKEVFARHDAILIDDSDANVKKFRDAGGKAIVFPRHNNSLHRFKGEPLKWVKQAMSACIGEIQDAATKHRNDTLFHAARLVEP